MTRLEPIKPTVRWALAHGLPSVLMRVAARRGDVQGRLITGGVSGDGEELQGLADEVRASGPLHRSKFALMTATLPVVRDVLTSPDFRTGIFEPTEGFLGRVASWAAEPGQLGPLQPPSLLVSEPPDHTRYRKLVTRVFTARAVEGLRERTQQIADELLDGLDPTRPVDLVSAYCSQLPVTVIAEVLGVPPKTGSGCSTSGTPPRPASTSVSASASSAGWSAG